MSLMNDALRKKKKEGKDPSGSAIFKDDSGKNSKNKVRIYAIAAIVLLVCVIAGFYLYEMISLSRPTAPALQSPPMAEPRVIPPEEPVSPGQDGDMPASSKTAMSLDHLPEKQAAPSNTTAMKPASPTPGSAVGKTATATAPLKTAEQPQKAMLPKTPPPVIEPEESRPQPEPAGNTNLNPTEETVSAIKTGADPVEDLFYRKGLSYHRQNKLEPAIQMYQAVLKKNPDHRSTRFNLASAYIQVGAFTEARIILEELNRQEPENPEILSNLAVVEIGLDRPEEALTFLESAEKSYAAPTFEILFHKGAAYSRMGDFETALDMYRKAERLAPENPRLQLNTAIVHDNLAQYDQAIGHYQIFLDRNTSLTTTEQREIETRVRELKAYLSQENSRPATNPQAESEQAE
ncbi:MAG: tetratricopeptide repeat protein [Desulfobacterales bacterium]|nr:tetratricopeptide repeat protein [Desulfobacterales bacterium]MDX2511281.1 tetratricopeptide repeat protein [Desulfobacterales bacterium]